MKYDNVLILGNGFDLDLGLETGYSNFLKSPEFADLLNITPSGLGKYLKIHSEKNKWLDLELLIGKYVNEKYSLKKEDFETDFKLLKVALISYLRKVQDEPINEKSIAYQLIDNIRNNKTLIINFNYTHSIERIISSLLSNHSSNIDHYQIHGTLKSNDIVVGVEDIADIPDEYIFLNKSWNGFQGDGKIINSFKSCNNLIIFGHSMGVTDSSFIKDVFSLSDLTDANILKNRRIVIFHKGETGLNEINAHLTTLIGKENLGKFFRANYRSCDVQTNKKFPENLLTSKKGFKGLQYL